MFTPVFAEARTVGLVAHWNEMVAHPETRIFHPGQFYTEPAELPARSERAGRSRSSVEFE